MDDQIVIAQHGIHVADGRTECDDIVLAPFESQRVFDPPLDRHHFQQRMIQQPLDLAVDQGVQVPELVHLHQIGVIVGQHKLRIVLQEEVGHVVQMNQPVQFRRAQFVVLAQFIAKQSGGLFQVVDKLGLFWCDLCGVVVDNHPVGLVQPRFETEVTHPGSGFPGFALAPGVVMISLQPHVGVEQLSREALQQYPRDQSVQIALVGQNYVGFGQ